MIFGPACSYKKTKIIVPLQNNPVPVAGLRDGQRAHIARSHAASQPAVAVSTPLLFAPLF